MQTKERKKPEMGSQPLLHQHGVEIQKFGTQRNLPIALASVARKELQTWVIVEHLVDTPIVRS